MTLLDGLLFTIDRSNEVNVHSSVCHNNVLPLEAVLTNRRETLTKNAKKIPDPVVT